MLTHRLRDRGSDIGQIVLRISEKHYGITLRKERMMMSYNYDRTTCNTILQTAYESVFRCRIES